VRRLRIACGSVQAQRCEFGHGPIAHDLSPIAKFLALASVATVSAEGWDEAWASA
jgi:hypothetical protein